MRRLVLFWLSLAFLSGIVLANWIPWTDKTPLRAGGLFALLAAVHGLLFRFSKRYQKIHQFLPVSFLFLLVFFGLGMVRYYVEIRPPDMTRLSYHAGKGVFTLEGIVCQDPQQKQRSTALVVCADMLENDQSTQAVVGRVMIHSLPGEWAYGDRLRIYGSLLLPPQGEDFSYRLYLAQRRIEALMEYPYIYRLSEDQRNRLLTAIFGLRQRAYAVINACLPQPQAGFLSGVLLGIEDDISEEVERAFQQTGTAHLVAISGYNMALLAGLVLKALRKRFSLLWTGVLAILVIGSYTILVGAAPAVIRAGLMSSLAMTAHLIGRKQAGPFTLVLTVAILSAFNPLLLWDAGFQLSVAATLGLVLYADRLSIWFSNLSILRAAPDGLTRLQKPINEYILYTLAAQITVLPVILYHFKSLSLSMLLANPLVLPVQPLVMLLGGLAVLIGLVCFPLGQLVAYLAWVPLAYTLRIVALIARAESLTFPIGQIDPLFFVLYYGILFLFTTRFLQTSWFTTWRKPGLSMVMLTMVAVLVWQMTLTRADGYLHILVIGQPNQRVFLLISPSGKRVLIGSQVSVNTLSDQIGRYLPLFDRHLDLVLLDPAAGEQLRGVPVLLERFPSKQIIWTSTDISSRTAVRINQDLMSSQSDIRALPAGSRLRIDSDLYLDIVPSDKAMALNVEFYDLRLSIPGSIETTCAAEPPPDTVNPEPALIPRIRLLEACEYGELISDGSQIWSTDNGPP